MKNTMINPDEVTAHLVHELSEIKGWVNDVVFSQSIYKSVQCLIDFTMQKLLEHDLNMVKKCMDTAETFYTNGSAVVRAAIENVFVYAFSRLRCICNKEEKNELKTLIPYCLHHAYMEQVLASRI